MKSKRATPLSPSSSWRENPQPCQKTSSAGCFPGFFHILFSKINLTSNRRKSLTLGSRKQERRIVASVSPKEWGEDRGRGGDASRGLLLDVCDFDAPPPPLSEVESRTKLIGALEKCDRDLEALQRTIDAIRISLLHHKLSSQAHVIHDIKCTKTGEAQTQQIQRPKLQPTPSQEEAKEDIITITKPGKTNFDFDIHINYTSNIDKPSPRIRTVSKEMIESVNEACEDVEWGERRELGKIGLSLQDCIYRDLIEDTVKELTGFRLLHSLPFDACRRKLQF